MKQDKALQVIVDMARANGEEKMARVFEAVNNYDPEDPESRQRSNEIIGDSLTKETEVKVAELMGMLMAKKVMQDKPLASFVERVHYLGMQIASAHDAAVKASFEGAKKDGKEVSAELMGHAGVLSLMHLCFAVQGLVEEGGRAK